MINFNKLPTLIIILTLSLTLLGVVMVYSSSAFQTKHNNGPASFAPSMGESAAPSFPMLQYSGVSPYSTLIFFSKQLLWAALGLTALLLASRIDYPRWNFYSRPLLLATTALLLLVWSPFGIRSHGATSWLNLRWFTVQPAEFAKLALVIFLAHLFSRRQESLQGSLWKSLQLLAVPGLLVVLVILQPDLGMATQIILLTGGIWFLAGARLRHLVLIATLGAVLLTFVFINSPNAKSRLDTFIHPEKASRASRYQILQAKIAFANGGLWGVGLGEGQQKMNFLPAPHTDFIFAILAEELGYFTSLAVLLAYGMLIASGFCVAMKTPDLFGTLLAGGFSLMLALGVLINIAVVTGSIPTTGLPLPILSYGGSSLMVHMIALGVILNISKNLTGVRHP